MGVKSEETSPNMNECLTFKEKLLHIDYPTCELQEVLWYITIGDTFVSPLVIIMLNILYTAIVRQKKKLVFTRGKKDVVFQFV